MKSGQGPLVRGGCGWIAAAAAVWASAAAWAASQAAGAADARQPPAAAGVGHQIDPMWSLVEADWIDADRAFVRIARIAGAEEGGSRILSLPGQKPGPQENAPLSSFPVTTAQDAAGACDGVKTGRVGFHTASNELDPWWQVDLGRVLKLDRVVIYNRTDGNTAPRTRNIKILVSGDPQSTSRDLPDARFTEVYQHNGETFYGASENKPLVVSFRDRDVRARIVRLQVPGRCSFALDEVEVYAAEDPAKNVALGQPADQKSVGPYSRGGRKGDSSIFGGTPEGRVAGNAPVPFSLAHTRQVVAQGNKLIARLRGKAAAEPLELLGAKLQDLDARLARLEAAGEVPENVRREVYLDARRLVRRIAFTNPLFDFDKILFVKRHDPGGLYHMVHQYYGFGAKPGGGLFVLCDPFSDRPKVVDLLKDSVVERGRLAGSKLRPGAFLSPEVSYDGRTILFAYTEGKAQGVEWSPKASFHIFKVNADGTGLVQLTDGPWNEFDPCFLPNGRIVFVSERRGGYLRCGGSSPPYHSPTYTLHSMDADGGRIACLSFHETQEWQPSVDHNGMIVYTRWDYIDRDTNIAHHIWSCYPDGRNPRSYHGNYPQKRENRPWMEMDIRAVPGSNRYVATAAAHHGLAFGSLVLIDYRPEDDGALSQLERLTPDVPFPEAEGGKDAIRQHMVYGTAWPLGEDDYLCVYDRHAQNRGIYWIDRYGNRELLYRDPEISCLSPIPLRPRPCPPRIPEGTAQLSAADGPATLAVMNVYDGDFSWPPRTKIAALRVIQILPKTVPRANEPRIGVASETNARAVLGTVPVEADGSAYFKAPAGKLVYFQALDDRGMAVQSMRSGTYLHPGEHLTCQGCHERKHRPPSVPATVPLALRRSPSKLQPEAEGANPFSYVRLVQPVLDRHCVGCHEEKKAVDLSRAIAGPYGWTASYASLAGKYGFYFDVTNGSINAGVHGGSRTVPGQFGARASKLLEYLDQRHYGVSLPQADFRRVTLWLDCNSEFLGAYHDIEAQARGEVVWPTLD